MVEDAKTLNDYGKLQLTNTMADLVQLFNQHTDNNVLVDELLSYTIDTGVFRTGNEKVNNWVVGPHNNLTFPLSKISNIVFTGFVFYFKSLHKVFTEVPALDLTGYNDGKLHLIYLTSELTYVIADEKYTGTDDYLYIGRFIVNASGFVQFYVMTRNAGTNPFDKNGVHYEVIDGLMPATKGGLTLTLSDGTLKYSGINIRSEVDTDILTDEFENAVIPLRYVETDNTVDWTEAAVNDVITNKVLNYETGVLSDVADDKYTVQEIYYDYPTKTLVVQYGDTVYNTYNQALSGTSTINYEEPDMEGMYVPLALAVVKAGVNDLEADDKNYKIIYIANNSKLGGTTAVDPEAQEIANEALRQAQAAQASADAAQDTADVKRRVFTSTPTVPYDLGDLWINDNGHGFNSLGLPIYDDLYVCVNAKDSEGTYSASDFCKAVKYTDDSNLNSHLDDKNNPHDVTAEQVGLGNVENVAWEERILSEAMLSQIIGGLLKGHSKYLVDGQNYGDLLDAIAAKMDKDRPSIVYKSTTPAASDYGRSSFKKGDIWIK